MENETSAATRKVIFDLLEAFNQAKAGPEPERPLAVVLRDDASNDVIGGLWGLTYYDWLFVELLFVPPQLRRRGVGKELMREAEAEAVRRGCQGAWLDTFTFQAEAFYEKLGYRRFGVIGNYPPGHSRVFMLKRLHG